MKDPNYSHTSPNLKKLWKNRSTVDSLDAHNRRNNGSPYYYLSFVLYIWILRDILLNSETRLIDKLKNNIDKEVI